MAVLDDAARRQAWLGLMRFLGFGWNGTKADLRAAVDATDAWIDSNQVSYNTALPVAFRDNATQAQKTMLLCMVAARRVSTAFVSRLIGGSID